MCVCRENCVRDGRLHVVSALRLRLCLCLGKGKHLWSQAAIVFAWPLRAVGGQLAGLTGHGTLHKLWGSIVRAFLQPLPPSPSQPHQAHCGRHSGLSSAFTFGCVHVAVGCRILMSWLLGGGTGRRYWEEEPGGVTGRRYREKAGREENVHYLVGTGSLFAVQSIRRRLFMAGKRRRRWGQE